jgi:hypothetical protein
MKLTNIGSNQSEVELNGITILFSYSTPVAAFVPGKGGLATSTKYSSTTSKHVNAAMQRWGCSSTEVEQEVINRIADRGAL